MTQRHTCIELEYCLESAAMVLHSGKTTDHNHHLTNISQKYAIDFVSVPTKGKRFTSNGSRNEDFPIFGTNILAPCDGIIAVAVSGIPDNKPGILNGYWTCGNAVIIQKESGEAVLLAHLKNHTLLVKEGDYIKTGQVLGKCGNTGRSSEPHLHIHVQDSENMLTGIGLPFVFKKVKCNGKPVELYDPIRGDILQF